MARLRIVFSNYDAPDNPYYGGGGAGSIHEVARRLSVRHDVKVVCGRFPGAQDLVRGGVAYRRSGWSHAGPRLGQLIFQFALPWQVRRTPCDLWVESLTPPFSTACLQKFTSRPVVALTQVLAGAAMRRKYGLPFDRIERQGLKTYRYVIALSEHLRRTIQAINPRARIVVIPNGVSREDVERPVQKDERHVLFLGRLDIEQKGLDLLLEAFNGIVSRTQVPLVIAGGGSAQARDELERRVTQLGLENRVRFTGHVSGADKEALLRQTMVLAMPSRFEASPVVLLEAFCYALPVLLFDIPELAEMPDGCCEKTPPFDATAYGARLLALLNDGARRERLGLAAKAYVRGFVWDDLAERYEEFFESVLGNR